ncbi:MAG: transmembrane 9 family protein, partial [Allorhizobium sp.]
MDNLPAAVQTHPADSDAPYKQYEHGYRLGAVVPVPGEPEERMMLNNHLTITILVHDYGENGKRVVGFVVEPRRSVLPSLLCT